MKINKKEFYSFLKDTCKDYGVIIYISLKPLKSMTCTSAIFDIKTKNISISINQTDALENVLSVFFHELAHLKNQELGKYPLYHLYSLVEIPKSKRKHFISTALRAEQYTDKIGKKLMKIYFPDLKYQQAYPKEFHQIDLVDIRNEYLKAFKQIDQGLLS